jgi:segregation and condensation protein B
MPEPVDILEALLFASEGPVELDRLREVLDLPSVGQAQELVAVLRERLVRDGRALQVVDVAGGVRLVTRAEVAPWLVRLARSRTRSRMSRPALEALAIVAYRQPVSKPEIDAVRGVNSEGVLDSLLERRLVRIAGRKETAGRPFLYETTREFLIAFGLRDLGDLPKPEGDLVVPADVPAPGGAEPPVEDGTPDEASGEASDTGERSVAAAAAGAASLPGASADAEPGGDGTGDDVQSGESEREDLLAELPVADAPPGEHSAGEASAPRSSAKGVAIAEAGVPAPAMAEAPGPSRPPPPGEMPPAPSAEEPGAHPRG